MDERIDEKCLIVRNFPDTFSEDDIREFMQLFDPQDLNIFAVHHVAVAKFTDKAHARNILNLLHQEALEENRLFVEYAPKYRGHMATFYAQAAAPNRTHSAEQGTNNQIEINDILKRLYATADKLNVNQPPPPNLRYEYPKVNRDIIDAISIALECVPKFYIQVVHLMNRMNLEPPFVPGDKHLAYASLSSNVQYTASATQTDEIIWQNVIRNKRKFIESDESEMSSNSSDERPDETTDPDAVRSKRMKLTQKNPLSNPNKQEKIKQKQRQLLKMQKQLDAMERSQTCQPKITDAFDLDQQQLKATAIKIVMPEQLDASRIATESQPGTVETIETLTPTVQNDEETTAPTEDASSKGRGDTQSTWTDLELYENRIPIDQLKVHPMFQNYSAGELSNRLYIKNLAKEVTEADLHGIYDRYLEHNSDGLGNVRSIDIRLMTTGRMKGQAFITFDGPYLNCDVDDETITNLATKYEMIEKARHETNGLILKGKPMVVVFGKKK